MYTLDQIRDAIFDPHRILREVNRLYHTKLDMKEFNTDGIDIFNQDWDNLIILDACRHDHFKEYSCLPGELTSRISRSASTEEFIRANFTNKTYHDVVYISGNSHYFKLREEINADLFGEFNFANPISKKDALSSTQQEQKKYTKSRMITEFAKQCNEDFPNKRLLIHYIPPHHPFKGQTAEKIFASKDTDAQPSRLFELIRRGEIDITDEELRTMYIEELERVFPYVKELLDTLPGKTVVSADHGELLGDRCRPIPHKGYGHHAGLYVDELVKVPWHVSQNGARKEIISDSPSEENRDRPDQQSINKQLEALGYKV